jgi:hypothetical protein
MLYPAHPVKSRADAEFCAPLMISLSLDYEMGIRRVGQRGDGEAESNQIGWIDF